MRRKRDAASSMVAVPLFGSTAPNTRVAVIAHDDPTIAFLVAINPRDHVPKRARCVIHVCL
jgi:hypothetical protein